MIVEAGHPALVVLKLIHLTLAIQVDSEQARVLGIKFCSWLWLWQGHGHQPSVAFFLEHVFCLWKTV